MIHLEAINRIHMIGIKGSGMTALAQVLQSQGKQITGSDQEEVFFTDQILRDLNIAMVETMSPANITDDIELVVVSAAWEQHPETLRAKELNIPIVNYPEMLGILSAGRPSIGVSGTHGKTTTTALLGLAAINLGLDPTVIVGSQVPQFHNTNAATGKGEYLIAETCEYRRHFLNFHPTKIIITNLEADHLDYFRDLEDIILAFQQYIDLLPAGGTIVCCIDSSAVRTLLQKLTRTDIEIITYGVAADAQYRLVNHRVEGNKQHFQIVSNGHSEEFSMQIPGKHNCLNATAVYALCQSIIAPDHHTTAILRDTIATYQSTTRRMQYIGKRGNMLVYDDYGHHPTEIAATLRALREFFPTHKIIASFMPHTYTRTQKLMDEFARAFSDADEVIINEIYASAREAPIAGISGERLAEVTQQYHPHARYLNKIDTAAYIKNIPIADQQLFVTIGAGDNWKISQQLSLSLWVPSLL